MLLDTAKGEERSFDSQRDPDRIAPNAHSERVTLFRETRILSRNSILFSIDFRAKSKKSQPLRMTPQKRKTTRQDGAVKRAATLQRLSSVLLQRVAIRLRASVRRRLILRCHPEASAVQRGEGSLFACESRREGSGFP
jgi:hypothetical protein